MKIFLFIIATLLLCVNVQGKNNVVGDNIDVTHYEIHINNLDFDNKEMNATTLVSFQAMEDLSVINFELKNLEIEAITSEDLSIRSYTYENDLIIITLNNTMTVGSNGTITINYSGKPFYENWGGVHWSGTYVFNLGVGFDSQPHNLGKTWFPCVDNFVDKATYDIFVTAVNGKKAICGGNLMSTTDNGDGTSTWHWSVPQEIPTYLASFAVGEYELWEDTYQGIDRDIPITIYVKPNQINKVEGTFVHLKEIARFLEDSFGPYPFNRIGYVSTNLGCMEHVDNIAFASQLITGNTSDESFIAHELSHMWFGNKATCSTAGDMWLNEGLGNFCQYYYLKDIYGEEEYQKQMTALIETILHTCHNSEGVIPLNNIPLDLTYGTTVYDKGAIVTHTLMNYLGRENFNNAMKYYLEKYSYNAASSEQLRDALTEYTGMDMTGFFDTWVFTPGSPHYNIDSFAVTPNGNVFDIQIHVSQKHRFSDHIGDNVIYEIAFMDEEWNIHPARIQWSGKSATITEQTEFYPIAVFGDYYNKTADARIESNNIIKNDTTITLRNSNLKVFAENVTDSVFLRLEHHLVCPDTSNHNVYGLKLSPDHFWTVFRDDKGSADIRAEFNYVQNILFDQNLILSDNDSVVLLYRSNASEQWQSIPYEWEGTWKFGRMTVNNLQSGDYILGAWDKLHFSQNELPKTGKLLISPNPADNNVFMKWDDNINGNVVINDNNGKIIKLLNINNTNNVGIDLNGIPAGLYIVKICDDKGNLMTSEKLIVR